MPIPTPRDLALANRAKKAGANYSLRIIWEARRAGIPISLAFALIEQESGFRNVFGHDPTIFQGAGEVTKAKYLAYKKQRGHTRMQGIGPGQLTWWQLQDQADKAGGAWKPKYNMRVAFEHLASLQHHMGRHKGLVAYNGTGPAAEKYARSVEARAERWHRILT